MKLVIRRAALAELNSIHDYISKANPFAAKSVVQRILKSIERLGSFPLSGHAGAVSGTRELNVPRLPYIVVYVVADGQIDVTAIFHAAQDRPRGFSEDDELTTISAL